MPVIASSFNPPLILRNGHAQTILPVFLRRRLRLVYERERLELDDGDFLDLDWARAEKRSSISALSQVAVLTHGLEGCAGNGYMRGMAAALNAAGWDALAWNFRSCSGEPNRLARFYHSGETGDLAAVIRHAAERYSSIALVGFSLGGNIILKYLGAETPHPAVICAAAISTPIDLASSARALDQRAANRIYLRRFLKTLVGKVEAKALQYPGRFDTRGLRNVESFQEFDDRYTAPIHGFRDAGDYWQQSSSRQYLHRITVPTLLLNARNDPFLTPESFAFAEAEQNAHLFLEAPGSGGHVGFLDFAEKNPVWSERRAVQFLGQKCSCPDLKLPGLNAACPV